MDIRFNSGRVVRIGFNRRLAFEFIGRLALAGLTFICFMRGDYWGFTLCVIASIGLSR